MARQAKVKKLFLIHYPTGDYDPKILIKEAAENYDGPIALAEDFMEFSFD